jgi:hypothetical protein
MSATRSAYAGATLFVVLIVLFSQLGASQPSTPMLITMGVIGAAAHLVLLPVVAAMPAPAWARAAGYGWLVIDTMLNVASVNGLDPGIAGALRLGGHASAVVWMAAAAQHAHGPVKIIGWPLAIYLGFHAFGAPWLPAWVIFPPFVTIPIWLVCIGRSLQGEAAGPAWTA